MDSQVSELFEKVESIVEANGGNYYTNDMYKEAVALLKQKEDEIRKEMEAKKQAEFDRYQNRFFPPCFFLQF
jgi:hypothetical protein